MLAVGRQCHKKVKNPSSISNWLKKEPEIRAKAMTKEAKKKTAHTGKQSKYHFTEGVLQKWIVGKRNKRIVITKRMLLAKLCTTKCLWVAPVYF